MSAVNRLNPQEFETKLHALGKYFKIAQELRLCFRHLDLYGPRYLPVLGYEIISHLLKHRFVDAVVNFNFDELLDQAIFDELGVGQFIRVISDGDFPAHLFRNSKHCPPLYIKPHGTVGHPSTLRFTREDYYGIPEGIREAVESVISGKLVTLIVLGFRMQSFEFNDILKKARPNSEIFYIDLEMPSPDQGVGANFQSYLLRVKKNTTISKILTAVYETTHGLYNPFFSPRRIHRHVLISSIFSYIEFNENYDDNLELYFHDRTVIELALAVAKGKGVIDLRTIANDRCGHYYFLYKEKQKEKKRTAGSIVDICKKLGLHSINYSNEVYSLEPGVTEYGSVSKQKFNKLAATLSANVLAALQSEKAKDRLRCMETGLGQTLKNFYNSKEYEMRTQVEKSDSILFDGYLELSTETALKFETLKMLQREDWDCLFAVAETGEWLLASPVPELIQKRKAKLYVIVANSSFKQNLKNKFGNRVFVRQLDWWRHNRHMTVLLKATEPVCGIYFYRRLRAPGISPIRLKDKSKDLGTILQCFQAYWTMTEKRDKWLDSTRIESVEKIVAH